MEIFKLKVEEEWEGTRLDKFLSENLDFVSRSFVQKIIKDGNVSVNGGCEKGKYPVKENDLIMLQLPDSIEPDIPPENIPLDILYEDSDVIVVNKPKSMVVHPAPGHYNGTLVNALMYHCKDSLSGINGIMRPGIVHRIDKDTTGSLIICKNDNSHEKIALQLKEHSIVRKYRAICHGVLKEDCYTIDLPIGRHPVERKKMAINEKNGKPAVTHVRVLQRLKNATYIECQLETGRTHQIRVHMASMNHPLMGDSVYCGIKDKYQLTGQTLHAYILGFIHPVTAEYIETTAPIPAYFENLIRKLS